MAMNDEHQPSSRRPVHILDFPDEVLLAILDAMDLHSVIYYETRSDISDKPLINFRSTCRRFYEVSSHLLIRHIDVKFTQSSISFLEEVSRHPTISKGVQDVHVYLLFFSRELSQSFTKFVAYYAQELHEHLDISGQGGKRVVDGSYQARGVRSSWTRILHSILHPKPPKPARQPDPEDEDDEEGDSDYLGQHAEDAAHKALLERAHREYQRLYAEQEAIRQSGKLVQVLAAAMARMPHAINLDISDVVTQYLTRQKLWDFPTRRGVGVYEAYYKAMQVPISAVQAQRRNLKPSALYPALIQIPLAICRAGVNLKSFKIAALGMEKSSDLISDATSHEELALGLQQLEHFAFHGTPGIQYSRLEPKKAEHLDNFLKSCVNSPDLKVLDLDPTGRFGPEMMMLLEDDENYEFPSSCLALRPAVPRQKLRTLNLWGASFRSDELLVFLSSLPPKMESLHLSVIRLTHGTWEEILDALRKKTYGYEFNEFEPDEIAVLLRGLTGGEIASMTITQKRMLLEQGKYASTNMVEDYVLRFTNHNPFKELRMGRLDDEEWQSDELAEFMEDDEDDEDEDMPDLMPVNFLV